MTITVRCLACGHSMELSEAYENYAGEVRCWACRAVLEVALAEGRLVAMRQAGDVVAIAVGSPDRAGRTENHLAVKIASLIRPETR